jgi:hypothetical protein
MSAQHWLRSIAAVVAGFVAVGVLSTAADMVMREAGVFPAQGQPMADGLFVVAATYRAGFTIIGGYITARLAPDRPMTHAWVLAAIGFVAGLAGVVVYWKGGPNLGPAWYAISIPVSAIPCIWIGARLRLWQATVQT